LERRIIAVVLSIRPAVARRVVAILILVAARHAGHETKGPGASIALHADSQALALPQPGDGVGQVAEVLDGALAQVPDDVAFLQAGPLRRTVRQHFPNRDLFLLAVARGLHDQAKEVAQATLDALVLAVCPRGRASPGQAHEGRRHD